MGVLVCYDDFTYDVVNDYYLDHLVTTGSIVGFDRSGHWVKEESAATPEESTATPAQSTTTNRALHSSGFED